MIYTVEGQLQGRHGLWRLWHIGTDPVQFVLTRRGALFLPAGSADQAQDLILSAMLCANLSLGGIGRSHFTGRAYIGAGIVSSADGRLYPSTRYVQQPNGPHVAREVQLEPLYQLPDDYNPQAAYWHYDLLDQPQGVLPQRPRAYRFGTGEQLYHMFDPQYGGRDVTTLLVTSIHCFKVERLPYTFDRPLLNRYETAWELAWEAARAAAAKAVPGGSMASRADRDARTAREVMAACSANALVSPEDLGSPPSSHHSHPHRSSSKSSSKKRRRRGSRDRAAAATETAAAAATAAADAASTAAAAAASTAPAAAAAAAGAGAADAAAAGRHSSSAAAPLFHDDVVFWLHAVPDCDLQPSLEDHLRGMCTRRHMLI